MTYKEISSDRCEVKFYGEIGNWMNNGKEFSDLFDSLGARYKFIDIRVHCYGGSVFEGNVIYNAMKRSKATIDIYIDGVAASMMTIAMLPANKIYIARNGFVMIHLPSASASGTSKDFFEMAKLLKALEKNFAAEYKRKTGLDDASIAAIMDGADHWFDAQECVDMKLCDDFYDAVDTATEAVYKPDKQGQEQHMYMRFAALSTTETPIALNNKNNEMKELMITMFGLVGLTKDSSDSAVAAAIKEKLDAANSLAASYKTKVDELSASQGDTLIAAAETAQGKPFDETQKANLKKLSTESLSALKMALSFLGTPTAADPAAATSAGGTAPAAPAAMSFIAPEGKATPGASKIPADRATWTWEQWCEKDEAGLKALGYDDQNTIYKASYKVEMPKA